MELDCILLSHNIDCAFRHNGVCCYRNGTRKSSASCTPCPLFCQIAFHKTTVLNLQFSSLTCREAELISSRISWTHACNVRGSIPQLEAGDPPAHRPQTWCTDGTWKWYYIIMSAMSWQEGHIYGRHLRANPVTCSLSPPRPFPTCSCSPAHPYMAWLQPGRWVYVSYINSNLLLEIA